MHREPRLDVAFVVVALSLAGCDEVTPENYVELVEGSRACSADTECVLAGEGGCTCASPVNVSAEKEVNETALEVECERVTTTECPAHENLRCEGGRCVTDGSP